MRFHHLNRDGRELSQALFTLVYETGVRIAEAMGLYVHDLNLARDNDKIRVLGKGNRERTVHRAARRALHGRPAGRMNMTNSLKA